MTSSLDPDQTAPSVLSWSTLLAYTIHHSKYKRLRLTNADLNSGVVLISGVFNSGIIL